MALLISHVAHLYLDKAVVLEALGLCYHRLQTITLWDLAIQLQLPEVAGPTVWYHVHRQSEPQATFGRLQYQFTMEVVGIHQSHLLHPKLSNKR